MHPRHNFEVGKEYGWLTVIEEAEKDRFSHRRFRVQCRCGKTYTVTSSFLNQSEPKCHECSHTYDMEKRRLDIVGKTINGWHVELPLGKVIDNENYYYCRCTRCGHMSVKTCGEILSGKGNGCEACPPEYHFRANGDEAVGILPNGSEFTIDAEDITTVQKHFWRKNANGYIYTTDGGEKLFLHRFVLGRSNSEQICVDHINRNKLDCRKNNLRIVTAQQNSMNRSLGRNNTTGYIGVCYLKKKHRYRADIGLNNKRIYLGTSIKAEDCAGMYNYAAEIIFKDFAGEKNPVDDLPAEQQRVVFERLRPHLEEARAATEALV